MIGPGSLCVDGKSIDLVCGIKEEIKDELLHSLTQYLNFDDEEINCFMLEKRIFESHYKGSQSIVTKNISMEKKK